MRRQTYGYLPSHKASPPIGWYQIILLGDRGTCVLTTCPGLHSIVERPGIELATYWSQVQRPNHSATEPHSQLSRYLVGVLIIKSFCRRLIDKKLINQLANRNVTCESASRLAFSVAPVRVIPLCELTLAFLLGQSPSLSDCAEKYDVQPAT